MTIAAPIGRWSVSALTLAAAALLVVHAGGRAVAVATFIAFAFLAPVWTVVLAALLLAGDWGSIFHASPAGSTALAVLLVTCVALRGAAEAGLRASGGAVLAVAGFLGLGLFVALVDGNHLADKGVWRAALPYLPLLLVAFRLDRRTRTRLLDAVAVVAVVYAVLFLLEETTSVHLLPGIATVQPADFGGTAIRRVESYGQLIPVLGFLWSLASLLTRAGSRPRFGLVAVLSLATIVAGLGRTALFALLIAGATTAIIAAGTRVSARPVALKILGLCVGASTVAFLYGSQRFGAAFGELSSGTGNVGVRLAQWHSRLPLIGDHLLFGVGFDAQPGLGTSDSSLVSALLRFGLLGLALTLVVTFAAFNRGARAAADTSSAEARAGLFACGGLVYLILAAATTSSLYYPLGIGSFGLVVALAWTVRSSPPETV